MELRRREFAVLMLGGAAALGLGGRAVADGDPLPSWNAGPAKDAIIKFVHATTDAASPEFVPVAERIATFDQDGTLWVEHPIYTQIVFAFDRVPQVVKERPELADEPAFKAVLSGDREVIASLSMDELLSVVGATLTGMDVETYRDEVAAWIKDARDPRWKRPFTDLVYQPQIELLKYLRADGYRTYIVTGGGGFRARLRRAGLRHPGRAGGWNHVELGSSRALMASLSSSACPNSFSTTTKAANPRAFIS